MVESCESMRDGSDRAAVEGHPQRYWPDRLAVYGTLRPDGPAWRLLRPWVLEQEEPVTLPGTLYGIRQGYPALVLGAGPGVPADLFRLRCPARSLQMFDRYEGPEYRRVRLRVAEERICWVYEWCGNVAGLLPLPWPVLTRVKGRTATPPSTSETPVDRANPARSTLSGTIDHRRCVGDMTSEVHNGLQVGTYRA